jgi:hypothetical protein
VRPRHSNRVFSAFPVDLNGQLGRTFDLSGAGCGVELSGRLQPGRWVFGTIEVGKAPFQFTAEVKWVRPQGRAHRAGLKFLRLDTGLIEAARTLRWPQCAAR